MPHVCFQKHYGVIYSALTWILLILETKPGNILLYQTKNEFINLIFGYFAEETSENLGKVKTLEMFIEYMVLRGSNQEVHFISFY